MRTENVELEILLGMQTGERPADVLYLCHSAALIRLANQQSPSALEEEIFYRRRRRGPFPIEFGFLGEDGGPSFYSRLLRGAGVILCPIFEDLKHEDYKEYRDSMTETRLSYRGIATDANKKAEYSRKLTEAILEGAFETLDRARGMQLPFLLRSSNSRPTSGSFDLA
jgi:hypothetical protein